MGVNYYRPLDLPEMGDLKWQEAILQCLDFAYPLLMTTTTTTAEPEPAPTMETEPKHTVDTEPELMPTTDPETEPVSTMEPEPAASSVLVTKPAAPFDQECEPVHIFVPVGVLVELGDKVSGHPHPPASKVNLSLSGLINFLMTSCSKALPFIVEHQVCFVADGPTQLATPSTSVDVIQLLRPQLCWLPSAPTLVAPLDCSDHPWPSRPPALPWFSDPLGAVAPSGTLILTAPLGSLVPPAPLPGFQAPLPLRLHWAPPWSLVPWLHLGSSSPGLRLGLKDLQCHPVSVSLQLLLGLQLSWLHHWWSDM